MEIHLYQHIFEQETQAFIERKNLNVPSFSFVILNFIIIPTKHLYGINNKSDGVGVVGMYETRERHMSARTVTCAQNQ